jgi:hypothetical protein
MRAFLFRDFSVVSAFNTETNDKLNVTTINAHIKMIRVSESICILFLIENIIFSFRLAETFSRAGYVEIECKDWGR